MQAGSGYGYSGYATPPAGSNQQQYQQGYYAQQPHQEPQQQQAYQNGYYSNATTPANAYPSPGYPPQTQQGYPPTPHGMTPSNGSIPPPTQSSYSAYPEHHKTAGVGHSFQGPVSGLSGWNDPPASTSSKDLELLKSVQNPVGLVVSSFTTAIETVKSSPNLAGQQRMIDDTEKRIDGLVDRLANHTLPDAVLASLVSLSNAMNSRDMSTANQIIMKMMTSNWAEETRWMVGAKRLIEMLGRV